MHLLRNSVPLPINYGMTLPPGEWLCQDEHAFQWAMMAPRGTVQIQHYIAQDLNGTPEKLKYPDWEATVKSILLVRSGAIGDLLLLTPCFEPLGRKYPNAIIHIACFQANGLKLDLPLPMQAYPVSIEAMNGFDLIIPLENIIELSTEKGQHATDAFAEALGVTVMDYRPVYKVTEQEAWHEHCGRTHKATGERIPRLGLQIHPSSQIRSYPMQHWNRIMVELLARGWEIMLLGQNDAIKGAPPAIKDCSSLSFREAAAVLSTCDVFLGPDSSFFNLCPALGVPAIGLFGPVDWRTRVKEGSGQYAIGGVGECAPCGWTNSRAGQRFPAGGPCNQAGFCVPLAEIDPMRVVAKVDAYRK